MSARSPRRAVMILQNSTQTFLVHAACADFEVTWLVLMIGVQGRHAHFQNAVTDPA